MNTHGEPNGTEIAFGTTHVFVNLLLGIGRHVVDRFPGVGGRGDDEAKGEVVHPHQLPLRRGGGRG